MKHQLETVRPGSIHSEACEEFSNDEIGTYRRVLESEPEDIYGSPMPAQAATPREFAMGLEQECNVAARSTVRATLRSKDLRSKDLRSKDLRSKELTMLSARALGVIEGAASRLLESDPELSHELSGAARDLWAAFERCAR